MTNYTPATGEQLRSAMDSYAHMCTKAVANRDAQSAQFWADSYADAEHKLDALNRSLFGNADPFNRGTDYAEPPADPALETEPDCCS